MISYNDDPVKLNVGCSPLFAETVNVSFAVDKSTVIVYVHDAGAATNAAIIAGPIVSTL
jgi:hypothetical protein